MENAENKQPEEPTLMDIVKLRLGKIEESTNKDDWEKTREYLFLMKQEGLIKRCKKEWLIQENQTLIEKLKNAPENEIEMAKADYLMNIATRVNERQLGYAHGAVMDANKDRLNELQDILDNQLEISEAVPETRLKWFRSTYRINCLELIAKFYRDLKKEDFDLFSAMTAITSDKILFEDLDFINPFKPSQPFELERKYTPLIESYDATEISAKFLNEYNRLKNETKCMDNDLKEIYVNVGHIKKQKGGKIKRTIEQLESFTIGTSSLGHRDIVDNQSTYKAYKNNFEPRVKFWKSVSPEMIKKNSEEVKDKIKDLCINVANEKVYNLAVNLEYKLLEKGLVKETIDLFEGITSLIEKEMFYMVTGEYLNGYKKSL